MWKAGASCAPCEATLTESTAVAVSGDGRRAVSASLDHTLKVWEVESGHELATLQGHSDAVDGSGGEWGRAAGGLRFWRLHAEGVGCGTGRELPTLQGHSGAVNGVALSGDGRRAVSASDDKTLKVWDVESGRELRTLTGHRVLSLAWR